MTRSPATPRRARTLHETAPRSSGTFAPIRSGRVFEEVVDQVRDAILSGRYGPGEKFPPERDLAAQFRVSRNAVREAIRVLELSGLVTVRHGGVAGVFVADIPPRPVSLALHTLLKNEQFSIPELFSANIFIEGRIAEEAALVATRADLRLLEANLRQTERTMARGGRPLKESLEFHQVLVRCLKNRLIFELERALAEASGRVEERQPELPAFWDAVLEEHRRIVRALRARSPGQARHAMVRHMKTVETTVLRANVAPRAARMTVRDEPAVRRSERGGA